MRSFKGPKLFALFFIVLLFFAGIYVVFSKQRNPSNSLNAIQEIASWKTFKNGKIGYSIKYPPDWKLRSEDQSGELYILSNAENIMEFQDYTTYSLKDGQTVENYLDSWPAAQSQPTQRIMINNYTSYIQRGVPDGGELSRATYLHIEHNNKYLNIAIIKGEYKDVSAILDTIKFGE